jgi:pyocin large subunit-like protein
MDHFGRHGHEFGFNTPQEYEAAAVSLFAAELSATLAECTRPSGDIARLDFIHEYFSVLSSDSFVRTLFKPRPRYGETKRDYFNRQCSRN